MVPIRLLREKKELAGTGYFEIQPGRYDGQHWTDGSVFIDEEVFGYLEVIIERHDPTINHFAVSEVQREIWERIIVDFEQLAGKLRSTNDLGHLLDEVRFFNRDSADRFASDCRANADALAELIRELNSWLQEELKKHNCVSVLGV